MNNKREEARRLVAQARAQAKAKDVEMEAAAKARAAQEAERVKERDVIPWLRGLGFRADEARRAAALCEAIPDAPLEERVRVALSYFRSRAPSCGRAANSLGMAV
jgi:Holliday junction resolvasome RuvABC DNA-binding subunit